MPATRVSPISASPQSGAGVELAPGETGVRLKDDPYYGKVDIGAPPKPNQDLPKDRDGRILGPIPTPYKEVTDKLQEDVKEGRHALDGEEQNHVEVLTGKRLQQKAGPAPRKPEEAPDEPKPKAEAKPDVKNEAHAAKK